MKSQSPLNRVWILSFKNLLFDGNDIIMSQSPLNRVWILSPTPEILLLIYSLSLFPQISLNRTAKQPIFCTPFPICPIVSIG